MRNQLGKAALILGLVSCGGNAVTENPYEACYDEIKLYEEKYISEDGMREYSNDDRLTYLNQLKAPCHDLDLSIIHRSDILLELGRYDEAIKELDRGISSDTLRVGNLYMAKANALRRLKHSGIQKQHSYGEIIELYKLALEKDNTVEPLIHLGWAEAAVLDGRLDEAMYHLETGADLKSDISRFFSLGAVVLTQKEQYEGATELIKIAVQKGHKNYFSEPDAVLAVATALCKLGRNEEAKPIVAQAQKMGGEEFMKLPDMVKAARMVLDCPVS